ncbi:hypothetical protein [Bordetella flabilis]|uniref:FAD-binding PCMH-type domain-containing protein n=1 Tax=Bordetella flabilis TaxID=463014 RepID=A0A193GIE4_9BORD|nr:hypothetical protein [Bordetella flabilis]ANN79363.1 hypothetical protein BAU07_21540 [Bordetella flabilis]
MQPSRRAFLMGRPAPRTPWQHFCERLRALCGGTLVPVAPGAVSTPAGAPGDGGLASGPLVVPQARWTPLGAGDVRQARALCVEHGVLLALHGLSGTQAAAACRPILWVDPSALNRVVSEPGPVPRWRADAGVTAGELAEVGLAQFAGVAPDTTLAAWYADRAAANWPSGRGDLSGIQSADILLADGVVDTLGPFGADDGAPLRSASLQALVPALFRLSSGPQAQWCREQEAWPAHYRLDALAPRAPATVNLAQLLHGHGGTLAWMEALVLQVPPSGAAAQAAMPPPLRPAQARAVDMRVKTLFDPGDLFPEIADAATDGTPA